MKNKPLPTKQINRWIKFTQIGVQMAITIVVCTFLGIWLDEKFDFAPYSTVFCSLFGVIVAIYTVIKQVLHELGKESS